MSNKLKHKMNLHSPLLDYSFVISPSLYQYLQEYCKSAEFQQESRRRSQIYVPLISSKFRDKVARGEIAADGFIWDLEDSIPQDCKQLARDSILKIPPKPGQVEYSVRINTDSPTCLQKDIEAVRAFPFDSITIAKGESGEQVSQIMQAIGYDKHYVVTIETVKGLMGILDIASVLRAGRDAFGFGIGDLSMDMGVDRMSTTESAFLQQVLGTLATTAKASGLDVFDSISARVSEIESVSAEANLSARVFGFTGKRVIHPRHVEVVNAAFSPKLSVVEVHLETLEAYLGTTVTNAHVIQKEYKGLPEFKSADAKIKRYLRQGYFPELMASYNPSGELASVA